MTAAVKPRPRPRVRQAPSSENANTSEDALARASSSAIEDEDALFIRNRNRGAKEWKDLNKAVKKVEREQTPSKGASSSSSEDDTTPSPRSKKRKHKKFVSKPSEMPDWTKKGGINIINLEDSDNDAPVTESLRTSSPASDSVDTTSNGKGKRKRPVSRSPSLTPPPMVTAAEQKQRRDLVAEVLRSMSPQHPNVVSITVEDDANEFDLSPELIQIMAETQKQPGKAGRKAEDDSSSIAEVDLRIRVLPHPEDESGRVQHFNYLIKRSESFEELFAEVADHLGILYDRVVMTYRGKRVFPTSSPATLSIWSAGELDAYAEHIYEYILEQRRERSVTPFGGDDESSANVGVESGGVSYNRELSSAPSASGDVTEADDKSDVFKLRLRSGETTVTVSVRPTTKCGAIVASFVKKLGLPPTAVKKAHIDVDGEAMEFDAEIGDVGLEDGDLVDIVGL